MLKQLASAPSAANPGKTLHEEAVAGVSLLIAEGDAPTIRWYMDQVMGSAKTTVQHTVEESAVWDALAKVLPQYITDADDCKAFLRSLAAELGAEAD